MRRKTLFLLVLFFLLTVTAFTQERARRDRRLKEKFLTVGIPSSFDGNFDPVEQNVINLQPMFRALYSTLFRLDADLRPYPFLVESYERTGKVVILSIKKEALFSDGSHVTATDAVYSIESGMKFHDAPNPIYKVIEGGEDFFTGKTAHCSGMRVLGLKRIQITLVNKNVEFRNYLAATVVSVLPRDKTYHAGKPAYSGAFRVLEMKAYKKENVVVLERNPHYISRKSNLDVLYLHYHKHNDDFETSVTKGEADLFLYNRHYRIPQSSYKYRYFKTPVYGAFYLKLNTRSGPFADKKLRSFLKSFILSLDLAADLGWELSVPAKLVLPYSLAGFSIFKQMEPGNLELLKPKTAVKVSCINPSSALRVEFFPLLKQKLEAYNIFLDLKWEELNKISEREKAGTVDLTSYYYLVDVPLSFFFYETLFTPGHQLNLFEYKLPQALQLLDKYRDEGDELIRLRILGQLEQIAQEEAFLIPVMSPIALLGYKDFVQHVKIDKFMKIYFEDIDVKARY